MQLKEQQTQLLLDSNQAIWKGPNGHLLDLEMQSDFPIEKIKSRKPTLWRYREALPVADDKHVVSFDEGFTPLLPIDFNGKKVWIKQDHLFPTGSYKDRGATVLMSHTKSLGIRHVVQDSSGNAGCAIAAYAAKAAIACDIYVPADTSTAKLVQIEAYGAHIHKVNGSREDTATAALKAAENNYYASHCYNPFFLHGTKTFAFEVCEQLNWKAPDVLVLPAGNGTLLLGCAIGFNELRNAGIINKTPKLVAIQSESCAPLTLAFTQNKNTWVPVSPKPTLAEGIAIAQPVRAQQMLSSVRDSGGMFLSVTETEIKETLKECLRQGYYIEPTSAATIAGLKQYISGYDDACIVSLFSGNGLKSTEKLLKLVGDI